MPCSALTASIVLWFSQTACLALRLMTSSPMRWLQASNCSRVKSPSELIPETAGSPDPFIAASAASHSLRLSLYFESPSPRFLLLHEITIFAPPRFTGAYS